MSPTALQLIVQDLSFSYPQRHVLSGWQGRFDAGLTWLQGPNGCGKSTLLKLLAGALPALTGQLRLDGAAPSPLDLTQQALDWRRRVIWCGPDGPVFDHLTPPQYFGLLQGLYPGFDAEQLRRHVTAFGLQPHLGQPIARLSSGTRRKVGLAAGLSCGGRVLLLDEPLNALDAASLEHLLLVLATLAGRPDHISLVVSHEVLPLVTRICTMNARD
jgi:ABC-type multidrug transport system ATPase subunit